MVVVGVGEGQREETGLRREKRHYWRAGSIDGLWLFYGLGVLASIPFCSSSGGGVARTNYTIQTQVAVSLYVKADRDKTCVGVVGTELVVTANWASL